MTTHITQTTHCFTLQQLRAATQAGGVAGVSLKGQGNGFFIQIQLRTGQHAVLVTARSRSPRMFKNPAQAFGVLRRVGIVTGSFDVTHYAPEQQSHSDKPVKKAAKKTASKVSKAKKAAAQAASAPTETDLPAHDPSPLDKAKAQINDPQQPSLADPSIQIDEEQAKKLLEEQAPLVGVQQSLI